MTPLNPDKSSTLKTNWRQTLTLRYFGLSKIPLILFVRPKVLELNNTSCVIGIPLKRRTQNHLKSMYFGALAIGADLAAGLLAMQLISQLPNRISLIFKDMHSNFLKRVDGDAVFTCVDGAKIETLINKVIASGERAHESVSVQVTVPDKYGDEVLATFSLTISLKEKEVD
ncbi:MAG: DUF4442 domain-containing protein [Candidatus Marinimicrobia bacterium]|nr:DUF4442 domain-containing protein [Candidatus Neomarinimicrobiota bacterium]